MRHPVSGNVEMPEKPQPLSGSGMDRAVVPSARKIFLRRAVRYGSPVAVVLLIWGGWHLVPASGSLSVKRDQLSVATVQSAPFLDYLPLRATVAPLHVIPTVDCYNP
ncbi:hypothetical protein [Acetobacter tropicalis]|uniref:hypothetical protein n=1 Tax=Acetobacter tropicalis TaxID=104102 RepID=UPI0005F031F4|nr:hypothetical protein [Acetobacter tropicalis]KXV51635.1 hypothetical protein AD944_01220 [Acetobacter tropicalis]